MESTEGIESLVKVATEFVRVSKEKKHAVTFESADTAGYTVAMKGFIKKLRDSFPNIYLEQSNLDGETLRYERPNIPRLANFEPRSSLALSMPRDVSIYQILPSLVPLLQGSLRVRLLQIS